MPLTEGEQLGHYTIQSLIGKGGMGEVYRARDTRLKRDVAIKVLPLSLSQNPERRARFKREAEILAALNHPNIATIYGVEDNAIVMELIEGETLPLGLDFETALTYAEQIAEALEAAHEKGIVHRDLKPANIKITPAGTVKVLDFGLSTAVQRDEIDSGNPAASFTLTTGATEAGLVLGTAAYMSPEQASGRRIDKRSDIWSFGVVLWEMFTGEKLFDSGETISDTLADVLRSPIDFDLVPDSIPAPIAELLRRCLDRDVKTRLRDIGEARIAIATYLSSPGSVQAEHTRARVPIGAWATAAVCALIASIVAFVHWQGMPRTARTLRMQVSVPEGAASLELALSPDGRYLALASANGNAQLWLRPLDALQLQALPGTEGASYPFWSPDGRYLGFFAQGKLKKILARGGPPQIICDAMDGRGASWNREDAIIFSSDDGGGFAIRRVAASGGSPTLEYKSPKGICRFPVFLPDGKHLLYVVTRALPEENGIYFRSVDSRENRRILPDESSVLFASGHLLFVRENTLIGQSFDPDSGQTTGDPIQVAPGVSTTHNVIYAPVTASASGILIYQSGGLFIGNQLTWFDRTGKRTGTIGAPGSVFDPAISPDGNSVAFMRLSSVGSDLWIWDLARSTERRFTTDPEFEVCPFWSPKADRIVFASNRAGGINNIFQQAVNGAGETETVLISPTRKIPTQWTRDGKWIVYTGIDPQTKRDIWTLPMEDGKPGTPVVFLHSQFMEDAGQLSPDENWMTYTSNESGGNEVYVRAFPSGEEPKKISTAGGQESRWRSDGKELYFISADRKMMTVPIKIGGGSNPELEPGTPQVLFAVPALSHYYGQLDASYDVTSDGKRFLLTVAGEAAAAAAPLNVVVNWDLPRQ